MANTGPTLEVAQTIVALHRIIANLRQVQGKELKLSCGGRDKAIYTIARWINNEEPSKCLALRGPWGTGKSSLLDAMAEYLKGTPRHTRVMEMPLLHDEYQDNGASCYKKYKEARYVPQGFDMMGKYSKAECGNHWIANDVGHEEPKSQHMGNKDDVGSKFLDFRYNLWQRKGVYTHMTTNMTNAQFENRYGGRIFDRIKEMYHFVELSGQSMRK